MTTKQDIRNEGFRHGQSVASWTDLPEIGSHIDPSVDYVGLGKRVTEANQYEYWELLANETGKRGVGNFPHLRALQKPYDVFDVLEAGIAAGIAAYGRKHRGEALRAASKEGV